MSRFFIAVAAVFAAQSADAQVTRYYARQGLQTSSSTTFEGVWSPSAPKTSGACFNNKQNATIGQSCTVKGVPAADSSCDAAKRPQDVSSPIACGTYCGSLEVDKYPYTGFQGDTLGTQIGTAYGATDADKLVTAVRMCQDAGAIACAYSQVIGSRPRYGVYITTVSPVKLLDTSHDRQIFASLCFKA